MWLSEKEPPLALTPTQKSDRVVLVAIHQLHPASGKSTLHTLHSTLYTLHFKLYTLYSTP